MYGEEFYARADPFEVYSTLVARLSVWGRRDGELVVRSPLANLDATPAVPALVAVVGVLFDSTSMVPIVVGYIAAHYLTHLVHTGQTTLVQMSDPLGTGADLLGTRDLTVSYWLSYHPRLLAVVKVLAVVVGHVLAVVAAHDRCVALLPPRHRVLGQLPCSSRWWGSPWAGCTCSSPPEGASAALRRPRPRQQVVGQRRHGPRQGRVPGLHQ